MVKGITMFFYSDKLTKISITLLLVFFNMIKALYLAK